MIITLKDPNLRIHGKLHKCDPYYFRVHYGKQRLVYIKKEYIDRPTENQKASRNTFTERRREVARQLHDPILKARWQAKFQADPQGYKFLHTYVYAQLKAGVTITQSTTCRDALLCVSPHGTLFHQHRLCKRCSLEGDAKKGVPTSVTQKPVFMLWDGVMVPIFLPLKVFDVLHDSKSLCTFAG